jgi:hypothetical protein
MKILYFTHCIWHQCKNTAFMARKNSKGKWFLLCQEHFEMASKAWIDD